MPTRPLRRPNRPTTLFSPLGHAVRHSALRPDQSRAFPAGLRPRHGRADRRDRGDRASPRRRASPTRSRRWSAAGDCSPGSSRVFSNLNSQQHQRRRSKRSRATTRRSSPQHHTRDRARSRPVRAHRRPLRSGATTLGLAPDQLRLLERHHLRFVRAGALLAPTRKRGWRRSRAARDAAHALRPERARTTSDAGSSCSTRPTSTASPLSPAPPRRRRRGARAGWPLRLHPRPLLGRAVPDLLGAPRPAPDRLSKRGRARGEHHGRARQPAADPRDPARCAPSRRGSSATPATPPIGSTTPWRRPPARSRPALAGLGTGETQGGGERAELQAAARAEGLNAPIEPWDWRYYAEKVRRARYAVDEAEVKPYFVLDNMVSGGVRHRGAALRPQLSRRAATSRSITPMSVPMRCATPTGEPCRPLSARQFRPRRQALGRLDGELPRPGDARWRGAADRRQQQQLRARASRPC